MRSWVVFGSMGCLVASSAGFAAKETPRPFIFGMSVPNNEQELQAIKALGCTNIRIGANWDLVESKRGTYDFSHGGDAEVRMCLENGLEPFMLIVATPLWALSPEKRNKPWGWPAEPEFYPEAARFYRMLAARYRGQVRYYEFWNEPNGYSWNKINAPEEYAPVLKIAYAALKQGNPDCVVAIGGLDGSGWKGYTEYLERLYELGCGEYFDAVAVHPYRVDGPIDTYSLKRIHEILVRHGHGDRKLWLTEYGWPNDYGHDNKARWLKETLDILTDPEYDFVFQASYHTLADFNTAEYGLCDADMNPRAAYQVYRDYPKDWDEIVERRRTPAPTPKVAFVEGFETPIRQWVPFGDGFTIMGAKEIGIAPEEGEKALVSGSDAGYRTGGAYLQLSVPGDVPVRLSARVLTDHGGGSRGFCRVGVDPTGATDPEAGSIIWGRSLETWNAWDSAGVGQGDPIYPKSERITLFLQYEQRGGKGRTPRVFDQVEFIAREDTFRLPEVQPIATPK